jgi:hypothetical protein
LELVTTRHNDAHKTLDFAWLYIGTHNVYYVKFSMAINKFTSHSLSLQGIFSRINEASEKEPINIWALL